MKKQTIGISFLIAIVILSAVIVNVNADKPNKYKLMEKNAPASLKITQGTTASMIVSITATERDVSGMFLDEFGNPHRFMSVYYTVSYDDLSKEIYYDEIIIPYEPIDIIQNNAIKKSYIESHAVEKWGWNMAAQEYGYNKITPGNQ